MAGTFTQSIFYKLTTSPNAEVQYTGINTWQYRIVNAASGATGIYAGGGNLAMDATGIATRTISPTGGGVLSPTWPTTAGSPVTIYVQEASPGTTAWTVATSSATVLAITNPAVSGTQSFATTAAATISHTPALSTSGAGGTLEYNATTTTTYSSTGWSPGARVLSRGTSYYLWARRGVGVSNQGAYSVYNGPFAVPYLSPNLTLGTVSPPNPADPTGTELNLTGGNTSNVSVNWTAQANHTYQVIRNDLASPALVIGEVSTGPQTLLFSQSSSPVGSPNSGLVDLPLEGITANYTIQVKRSTASGGDGLWYDGTGTNHPFAILRIKEPTLDDTQDFNTTSPTPISHPISLKANGLGGTLQYGWSSSNTSPGAVTNWQTSNTFSNVFVRGNTYYFYARRSTDNADWDVSTAQVVPPLAVYGLLVNDTAGSPVFNTSTLPANLITCKDGAGVEISSITLAAGATSSPIFCDGMTSSNGTSVFLAIYGGGAFNTYSPSRSSGYFTINNITTGTVTYNFVAGRYK